MCLPSPWVYVLSLCALLDPIAPAAARPAKPVAAYVYYEVPDRAFERAARTHAAEAGDKYRAEFHRVKTKKDFLAAWEAVRKAAVDATEQVGEVHLFTHASKQAGGQDGLEFAAGPGGGTVTRQDLAALPKLPWGPGGSVTLHGCNTGLEGERKWCPADALAKGQGVPATGQAGYSYFSSDPAEYKPITAETKAVYLWAYKRGKNGAAGDGKKMDGKVFRP